MTSLRIFVSSPGDVAEERALAQRVIAALQGELAGRVELVPIIWEHEPLLATAGFQEQIVRPSETDVVITILWSRLGTRLPPQFVRADGSRYASGTEYELEDAVAGFRQHGRPQLLVYRRRGEALVRLDDRAAVLERLQQKEALDAFVAHWFHDAADGTLRAAFHAYATPDQFADLLATHLRKLIRKLLPPPPASDPGQRAVVWQQGSPFRGLQPFEREHAGVFFGRGRAVGAVLDALRRQALAGRAFTMVVGASGSGKSSLLRAGVLPLLTQPGVVEGIGHWRSTVMRPGDLAHGGSLLALAAAILRPGALPELGAGLGSEPVSIPQLADRLRDAPETVPGLVRRALSFAAMDLTLRAQLTVTPRARLLVIVDQLEELFLLDRLRPEQTAFAAALAALAASGEVWVLAALRSDCYRLLAGVPAFVDLKEGAGQVDLLSPSPQEVGQMIRQPALAAGLRFEEDAASGERLEDLLRDAALGHPGSLPLLELTLEELYQRRGGDGLLSLASYREIGGLEGALVHRAERALAAAPPAAQASFGTVMRALIELGDDPVSAVDRRAPMSELVRSLATRQLVDAFVAARLLVADKNDEGEAVVGLAHRTLLRHWPRLVAWMEADSETLRARGRLAVAAARWCEEGRSGDYLLPPGRPLEEAAALLARPDVVLSADERSLVFASAARRSRLRRLRRAVRVGLVALSLVALLAALVADWQRRRAREEAQRAEQVSRFLARMFEVADPARTRGGDISVPTLLADGVARVDRELAGQPLAQARVLVTIGDVYRRLGDLSAAAPLLDRALAIRQEALPAEHPDLAESLDRSARLSADQGRYGAAEQQLQRAIAIRRRSLGARDPAVAESLTALGNLLRVQLGRYAEAEAALREALAIREQAFGRASEAAAESAAELAGALQAGGRLDEAESLLREVLGLRRRLAGPARSLEVAASLHDLAELLTHGRGDPVTAEPLYREALAIEREILGEEHPRVAWELNDLGIAVARLGRAAEGEELLRQALAILRRSRGERHPDVATVLDNLAQLVTAPARRDEAEEMLRTSLAIRREGFGDDDYQTSWSYHNLGVFLARKGALAEASELLEHALSIRRRLFRDGHMDVAVTLDGLGLVRMRQQDWAAAVALLRESLAMYRRLLPEGDAYLGRLVGQLGVAELAVGDADAAASLLRQAVGSERGRDRDDLLATLLAGLGEAELTRGQVETAEAAAVEAVSLRRRLPAAADGAAKLAYAESVLAGCLLARGELAQAEALVVPALGVLRGALGDQDLRTRWTLARVVTVFERSGRVREAERYRRLVR